MALDAEADVILTHSTIAPVLEQCWRETGAPPIRIISVDRLQADPGVSAVALPTINSADLALLLYTLGSTGKPKGVAVGHSGRCQFGEIVCGWDGQWVDLRGKGLG